MEPWKKVCIYVSIYAILREFRPIDPFVIKYLTLLPEKYTIQIIREDIYPVGSYVSVFFVVIIFLITDYLQYKPIIILNGLSGIVSYGLLLGYPTITVLKVGQVFQMLFRASEVAYYTYMFAKINNKDQYQIATSRLRTSVMIGKFSCGIIAQVLISCYSVSYTYLLYLSIIGMVLTTIWSLIMPSVKFSLYFYKENEIVVNSIVIDNHEIVRAKIIESIKGDMNKININNGFTKMKYSEVLQKLWADFKISYEDLNVLKWSVWWSLSLCGYVLVSQYIQLQWQEIASHEQNSFLMNGAAESLATLLSAAAAYVIGIVNGNWDKYGELIMSMVAIGLGIMLSFLAVTQSLTKSYIYYIIFCFTYQTMLTISSAEVAKFMKRDCYALVFGFNKFIAYILITIFTAFVVEDTFFSFNIRQQFLIYSIYFVFLGCFFMLISCMSLMRLRKKILPKKPEPWS